MFCLKNILSKIVAPTLPVSNGADLESADRHDEKRRDEKTAEMKRLPLLYQTARLVPIQKAEISHVLRQHLSEHHEAARQFRFPEPNAAVKLSPRVLHCTNVLVLTVCMKFRLP